MITPTVALIGVLLLFVLLDSIKPLFANLFILIYFLFAYINLEGSSSLAIFYAVGILLVIVFDVARSKFSVTSEPINKLGGLSLKGKLGSSIIGVGLGVMIFLGMRLLQGNTAGAIIGTPSLAISSPAFNVTTIMLLGIVETRMFFLIFNIMKDNKELFLKMPLIGRFLSPFVLVLPIIAVSALFGLFHLSAYASNVSSVTFAVFVMAIWVISYYLTKSDLPANISHALWNGVVSLSRALGIAI